MADLFDKQFSILPGLLDAQTVHTLIPDNKTASSIVEGFKQGQSGNYDYNRLLTEELPKVQEQIAKQSADAQSKADKLSQKMQRYSMIGNILSGIGTLANTVNTAYMAAAHGKRAAQIGTPLTEFGGSLAKQGLGYGEEAREYGRLANRSPAEMLGVISEKAKIGQIPFDENYKKEILRLQALATANAGKQTLEDRIIAQKTIENGGPLSAKQLTQIHLDLNPKTPMFGFGAEPPPTTQDPVESAFTKGQPQPTSGQQVLTPPKMFRVQEIATGRSGSIDEATYNANPTLYKLIE